MSKLKKILLAESQEPKLLDIKIVGYSQYIVLFKHYDGRLFCTASGKFCTFDRNGKNHVILHDFWQNGYPGHDITRALLLPSGTVLVALSNYIDPNMIFLRSTNETYTAWEQVHNDFPSGTLYRSWATDPSGKVLLGEYGTNDVIRLWEITDDGEAWNVLYSWNGRGGTQPIEGERTIFHIHCAQYDPFTGDWWIGVGDTDAESAVYRYDGNDMILVGDGKQDWRTVSFIFTEDYVIWGADGRDVIDGKVYIVRLNRITNELQRIKIVDDYVLNSEKLQYKGREIYLICEDPNQIFLSNDGYVWRSVKKLRLNPELPFVNSSFKDFVDNKDGRIFAFVHGILREDNNEPFNNATIIMDIIGK